MCDYSSLTFEELAAKFINGNYELDSEEYLDAGEALHFKLDNVSQLVPLLRSNNVPAQRMAVYIASEEGSRALPIFDELIGLLNSPIVAIRDDVCACFSECATNGEQILELINLIDTDEQRIRLKVMFVLSYIAEHKLHWCLEALASRNDLVRFEGAIQLLFSPKSSHLEQAIVGEFEAASKLDRVFIFIKAVRESLENEVLNKLSELSNCDDIKRFYEIYCT